MEVTNTPAAALPERSSSAEMPSISLPPETWAHVMELLDLSSVLSLTAVSRTLNRDVTKLVTKLHITKSCHMHSSIARRFRDIREIYLYSFVQYRNDGDNVGLPSFHSDTIQRTVPFLTNFVNLEKAFFGSYNQFTNIYQQVVPFKQYCAVVSVRSYRLRRDVVGTLIEGLSAAFRVGTLPARLELKGLQCPFIIPSATHFDRDINEYVLDNTSDEERCPFCTMACRSFPVPSVAAFEHQCVSTDVVDKPRNLIVCFNRSRLAKRLKKRPGGKEFLASSAWLCQLLSQGECFSYKSIDGKTLLLLDYERSVRNAIREVIANDKRLLEVDPNKLTSAVMKCFDYHCQDSSKKEYMLSCKALQLLQELHINLPTEKFGTSDEGLTRFRLALEFSNAFDKDDIWNVAWPDFMHLKHLKDILLSHMPPLSVDDINVITTLLEPKNRPVFACLLLWIVFNEMGKQVDTILQSNFVSKAEEMITSLLKHCSEEWDGRYLRMIITVYMTLHSLCTSLRLDPSRRQSADAVSASIDGLFSLTKKVLKTAPPGFKMAYKYQIAELRNISKQV